MEKIDYNSKNLFIVYAGNKYFGGRFTLCGIKDGDSIKLGVSFLHEGDKFNRKEGRELAYERAVNSNWRIPSKTDNPKSNRKMLFVLSDSIEQNLEYYRRHYI
jgi:hypothetical protein